MAFYSLYSLKPKIFKNEKYYHSNTTLDFTYKIHAFVAAYRSHLTPESIFNDPHIQFHHGLIYVLSLDSLKDPSGTYHLYNPITKNIIIYTGDLSKIMEEISNTVLLQRF
jgi:hypothetical protein